MGNRIKKEKSITDSVGALTITPCQENPLLFRPIRTEQFISKMYAVCGSDGF